MAVGLSAGAAQALLGELASSYTYVQLHVGDPGANGTANVATENTRQQVSWASASGGSMASSADLQWTNVADDEDYTHFSVWSAASTGNFGFSGTITANAVSAGDTFTIPAGDLTVSLATAS